MSLSKADPVYYKKKITDLIKQARENGLNVRIEDKWLYFEYKDGDKVIECAGVEVK